MPRWFHVGLRTINAQGLSACIWSALILSANVRAQSLDERLDEEAFLRGVIELRLPEVLKAYVSAHPTNDPFQAARFAIAAERITLSDPSLSVQDRFKVINRIREIRVKLLSGAPAEDPRAAAVLADQASDTLFDLFPTEALGITTMFGVPSAEQQRIAKWSASEIYSMATQAQRKADQAIRSLEARSGFATDFELQDQRRRLAEDLRDLRIPFLLGVGTVLQAELNTTNAAQKKTLYDTAVLALSSLMNQFPPAVQPTAHLYLALALAGRGEFDSATRQLEHIKSNEHASAFDALAARLASVRITSLKDGPAAGLQALDVIEGDITPPPPRAFQKLLLADQRFMLCGAIASAAPPEQRAALLDEAFSAYTDLLSADLGAPREAVQAAVFERLVLVSPDETSSASLPPIVIIARADRLAAQGKPEAAAMLINLIQRDSTELPQFEYAMALFVLGKALYATNQRVEAARRFIELADRFPADPQAARAIDLGVAIAAEARRAKADKEDAGESLERGLEIALSDFTNAPTINQWRLLAAQLALEKHQFDNAARILRQIPTDANQGLDAQYLLAVTAHRRADAAPDDASRRALHEAALPVIEAVALIIGGAMVNQDDQARMSQLGGNLLMLHVLRAQTLLALNRPSEAMDVLSGIEQASSSAPEIVAEAMRVRIECHQALGQPEKAVDEVKRFLEASPTRAVATVLPLLQSIEAKVLTLLDEMRDADAQGLAERTLLPIARLLEAGLSSGSLSATLEGAAGERIAEAYRLSGNCPEALTWYERLLVRQPDAQTLLLGRAECLYALGGEERLAQAMTIYKRIAAGSSPDDGEYWLSQLRMLQILDATGRNTQQIVPRIDRLRQGDAKLGGERYRRGFDALRSKHAT